MSIKVGLLGFGRTGSLVAKEIVTDPELELCWVCRNNIPINQKFASHSLGYDDSFAHFINPSMLNDQFLMSNPVDLVIDFSAGSSSMHYQLFAKHKVRIVTAISKYSEDQMSEITEASTDLAGLNWSRFNVNLGLERGQKWQERTLKQKRSFNILELLS